MKIDLKQLEINLNLHALQPEFLNLELHYIIAENENTFRFADWNERPRPNEEKFYCFLKERELMIPAGNIRLRESYIVTKEPLYPSVSDCTDFLAVMATIKQDRVARAIRKFFPEDLIAIENDLRKEFPAVRSHVVASPNLRHYIFVVDDIEISVSPTMVYFRMKAPFSESHYQNAGEDYQ